jgi:hypothetical protein
MFAPLKNSVLQVVCLAHDVRSDFTFIILHVLLTMFMDAGRGGQLSYLQVFAYLQDVWQGWTLSPILFNINMNKMIIHNT